MNPNDIDLTSSPNNIPPSPDLTGFETWYNQFPTDISDPLLSWLQLDDDNNEPLQYPPNLPTTDENLPNPGGAPSTGAAPSTVKVYLVICNRNLTE